MEDYDLTHLIINSEVLKDARTYGYYVREQIEAHGSYMPEWLMQSLVDGADMRINDAVDFLLDDCELSMWFDEEHVEIMLESITVRNMTLEMFSEFIQELIEEAIDPTEDLE